ncbi:DUF551 domain-containing protein [Leclercia adecarboxylata]|uniref:DUF551 domain-containing protein n=1 Tax=Leclercia adecarboxylata TaxID=83655 RepID=UPI002026D5AF|nr:DUF551 domain-containing protein [Leclercia adecarboxylata]
MAEFTKEQLIDHIRDMMESSKEMIDGNGVPVEFVVRAERDIAVYEIALAALTAGTGPVAYMYRDNLHADARFSLEKRFGNWSQEDINEYEITEIPLYAAPQLPQPAVVSDEMIDTFEAEFRRAFEVSAGVEQLIEIGYQGEKFSLSIRDAATWWKLGRDAILKHSAPFIVTSDHRMMEMPKAEDIDAVAAMLQGAEPVQGWIPCSERMPTENDIVLVVDDGYFVCEAQYREGDFFSAVRGKGEFFEGTCRDVELWMPLPAAPQQEADNG